jgi:hypothetical protein
MTLLRDEALKNYGRRIRKRKIDADRQARTCHLCKLHQLVETTSSNGSFLRQKAVVHSIDAEVDQPIGLGDYDLLIGDEIIRLKHIADDPAWLILSSNASAVCV